MESEVREQPALLSENSGRYFGELSDLFGGRKFEMVLLAARGSSDNAALYARYLIEIHLGIPVSLAAPSVWTRYGGKVRFPRCLAVGISQSGAAPDVAEVIGALRADGHATLAITNTPGSRLTQAAEHSLTLDVGPENSVAATKTYTASLLALYQLVRALGGDLPEIEGLLPDDGWCEQARIGAESGVGYLVRSQLSFALARGYSFCTALETALKLMECALLPCKPFSAADFQHGPKALAGPGTSAIVYGEPQPWLEKQGCLVVHPPSPPKPIPEPLLPLWETLFGQWIALLAARARNLNPDDPRYLDKITETR